MVKNIKLTNNGKVDRQYLLGLKGDMIVNNIYIEPKNEIQKKLVDIWKEILEVNEPIGIDDNFFNLGGDSFKIISLAVKIKEVFGIEMRISLLISNTNIQTISNLIMSNMEKINNDLFYVFNNVENKKIFCFPPIIGYGLAYKGLADIINNYSFYAFNFIERESRIREYADAIINIQRDDEYTLLGYSAGGNLAFEVSKELESRGLKVSNIIIIDSQTRKRPLNDFEIDQYNNAEELEKFIVQDKRFITFKEEIISKSTAYGNYFKNIIEDGIINAKIHLIKSGYSSSEFKQNWRELTNDDSYIYIGSGMHKDMLSGESLERNAEIVTGILEKI